MSKDKKKGISVNTGMKMFFTLMILNLAVVLTVYAYMNNLWLGIGATVVTIFVIYRMIKWIMSGTHFKSLK